MRFYYYLSKVIAALDKVIKSILNDYLNQHTPKCLSRCGKNFQINLPVFIYGKKYIEIGDDFFSQPGLRIECYDEFNGEKYSPKVIIGNRVSFNFYCHIGCINKIVIGNNVMLGSRVLIEDHSHGNFGKIDSPYRDQPLYSKGSIIIEDDVWIGENACIMPGVRIGKGSIIGANAVVTHDIPSYSVAVGVPAKVIKKVNKN